MELYLCEKPKVGNSLARILGAGQRQDGYATDGANIYVTWAIGHLLEVLEPGEYDDKWSRWSIEHLPIIPDQFQQKVKNSVKKQYGIVEKLVKKATKIYIATDIDREGEAIAREILDRAGYWGEIYRVPIVSLDTASIRQALSDVAPGQSTFNLYHSAIGRARADWLIGMNFSRLATLTAQATGSRESLPVGRVLTAIVALVAHHDQKRTNFTPHDYFTIDLSADFHAGTVTGQWIPGSAHCDDHGRCTNQGHAQSVAGKLQGRDATVSAVKKRESTQKAPLPFDMTALQQYCANRWGYSASKTLKAAQELYETHTVITYPRTDNKYLPDSQFGQVQAIIDALNDGDPELPARSRLADPTTKPACYNTAKVSAHHAIIPTTKSISFNSLPEVERNVFDAVRLRFLAQFCPGTRMNKTRVTMECEGEKFVANGTVTVDPGWRSLFGNDDKAADPKDEDDDENESKHPLPDVSEGDKGPVLKADLQTKQTQPPKAFTESSLLGAMNNVGRFVDEPELKKILDEKDGIGTQATRASILDNAFRYGYLKRSKKQIIATDKAYGMLKIVPPAVASPGMTAGWEKQLDKIAAGELELEVFEKKIQAWIRKIVSEGIQKIESKTIGATASDFGGIDESAHSCFECGGSLRRIAGKHGHFWACQKRDECGATFPDVQGKPKQREKQPDNGPECPECGKSMRLRIGAAKKGKGRSKGSSKFWGCSGYPDCKSTIPYEK